MHRRTRALSVFAPTGVALLACLGLALASSAVGAAQSTPDRLAAVAQEPVTPPAPPETGPPVAAPPVTEPPKVQDPVPPAGGANPAQEPPAPKPEPVVPPPGAQGPETPAPVQAPPAGQDPVTPPPPAQPVVPEAKPVPPEAKPVQPEAKPVQPEAKPVGPEATPANPAQDPSVPPPNPADPVAPPVAPPAPPESQPAGTEKPAPAVGEGTASVPLAPASSAPVALPAALAIPKDLAAVSESLERLASERATLARKLDLGTLTDGRKLPALLFGGEGPLALEARPVILLLGALDGESPTGGLAVLQVASELLREPANLSPGVAFAAVPWASPEALELTLQGRSADGRNTRPVDEDRDGRVDEDGPDDLDGDGTIVQMLVEDPDGPWVRPAGQRLLARAKAGDAPRYSLALEGKDDDGDGEFNEDGTGGVILDLNFPVGRTGPWTDNLGGVLPLSESLARNFADFALVRRAAVVILFQGSHGRLAIPGGTRATSAAGWMPEADRGVYERVHASFLTATSRRAGPVASLLDSRGRERRGAALDWFYSVAGALAVEVAPWGPALDAPAENGAENARLDLSRADDRKKTLDGVSVEDQAWIRWLDDTSGGIGFIDWHPVDVGRGRQVLVGGWEPGSRTAPSPEHLPRALQGLADFTRRISASLPRLELRISEVSRDGEVCRIRARLSNAGLLPTGLAVSDKRVGADGAWLALELPAGAKLIAGSERCKLARLAGGGISRECEWLVVAPAGSSFSLRAGGDWALSVAKEVTP